MYKYLLILMLIIIGAVILLAFGVREWFTALFVMGKGYVGGAVLWLRLLFAVVIPAAVGVWLLFLLWLNGSQPQEDAENDGRGDRQPQISDGRKSAPPAGGTAVEPEKFDGGSTALFLIMKLAGTILSVGFGLLALVLLGETLKMAASSGGTGQFGGLFLLASIPCAAAAGGAFWLRRKASHMLGEDAND